MEDNKSIQGNMTVSGHQVVGGNSTTRGNAIVEHDLKVKGWIDARNIKGTCKGLYGSEEELKDAYPEPNPGWFALVGDTLPASVYRVKDGQWIATGEQGGEFVVDLDNIKKDISDLRDDLIEETRTRESQDSILQANIDKSNKNLGTENYEEFSDKKEYPSGAVVRYNGLLYKFKTQHAIGAWDEEEVEPYNIDKKISVLADTVTAKTVAYDKLDTIGFDQLTTENISNLEEQAANGAPLRYHVSPSANGLPEGVLEVWLDSMAHVVVEKITTSAVLDASSQQFTGAHTDFTQSTYIRYLNINAPSSPVGTLQWTKWQIYESTNTTGYRYALLLPDNPPTTSEKVFGIVDGGTVGVTLENYLDPTGKPVEIEANTIGLLLSQWDRTKQENRWLKGTFPASRAGIAIKNITFTPIMAWLLNTLYENYSACEADTSKSYSANDKVLNPLKLTNKSGKQEDTNLLAWGEFIISHGKLKNQSPGTRTLAIIREKGVSQWPSTWRAGDKIIITRTSSEPISIEYTNSSSFKLTTDGMVDTIEFYSNHNAFTDYKESAYLLLSIPRETYIESIKVQYVDRIHVLASFMDGTNVWWDQYRNPANGEDVDDLKERVAELEKNSGSGGGTCNCEEMTTSDIDEAINRI